MNNKLMEDRENQNEILQQVLQEAQTFLDGRAQATVAPAVPTYTQGVLQNEGVGAKGALEIFKQNYQSAMQVSSGPRFFGYVIGGTTPAALAGDWLTSLYDQNAFGLPGTLDRQIELEVLAFLRQMLALPESFSGVFTTGGTMSNYTCLAVAREWAAAREGKTANDGIYGLTPPTVLTGMAHASIYKDLSMLGIGRAGVTKLPCLPGREAVDPAEVEKYLAQHPGESVIVIANMGTVNAGDIDDLAALAALKDKYDFYLHCEGAIGMVAAASEKYRPLFAGVERADSLSVDCHKWLNTPYDGGVAMVNGPALAALQHNVFAQMERVDGPAAPENAFYNIAPEGSRRFRALPAWFSLMAYGKDGYAELIERNCALAQRLAQALQACSAVKIMNEVRLNVVSFTLNLPDEKRTPQAIAAFANALREEGTTFLNTATLFGEPVVRCCISNWLTEEMDVDKVAAAIAQTARDFIEK
ncbi:aspartate aminotransferase family protein [Ruminococcaceae bacterium OttesenSCG-928-N02]|nr:aspartate aminotransferase family protein [Ruminococcaceae bacterium OttesenSCG-928-N02]